MSVLSLHWHVLCLFYKITHVCPSVIANEEALWHKLSLAIFAICLSADIYSICKLVSEEKCNYQ